MKETLEGIAIPGEDAARERTRAILGRAFTEREPTPRPSHWPRIAAFAVALSALVAASLSSPGRAVFTEIREAVGVKRAQPALFSLPAPGRLLVASDAGVWVVQQDGSKRLLGDYREASWSPFGRFVVATRENELAALEPDGDVRWTLARPGVRQPRWAGDETDTRIAYLDRTGVRLVAGDGTGDRILVRGGKGPIAWRPGPGFVLAYTTPRRVRIVDVRTGRTLWSDVRPTGRVHLEWSHDGLQLLVLAPSHVRLYGIRGNVFEQSEPRTRGPHAAAARPGSRQFALALERDRRSSVYIMSGRRLFDGTGAFGDLAWSPDGRWLLVTWPTADQWVVVRASGRRRIRAIANVSEQFRSASFPRIEGWCCAR